MNELKYCKFCDKEKPVKDFCKSGFAIKNICKECQNKKQTQIYRNSKKVDKLQKQLTKEKDNWNKLKEYANKMHEYFLYTDVNEIYKQNMKEDNQFPNLFNLSELNASDKVLSSILNKMQELEQEREDVSE